MSTVVIAIISMTVVREGIRHFQRKSDERAAIASIPAHPRLTDAERLRMAQRIDVIVNQQLSSATFDADLTRATHLPIRNDGERRTAARVATAKGMAALPAAALDEFFALRLSLAAKSPVVCAGLWSGQQQEGELFYALSRLTTGEFERWLQLSVQSARLAMSPSFVSPAADDEAIQTVFRSAREAISPADQGRFDRVLQAGVNAVPEEGCATVVEVFRQARAMEPTMRVRFYRALLRE
jgi:hypothetical protein